MKTNSAARWFVRIRVIVICLALVGMVGVAFSLGESLAARVGQTTVRQTDNPAAPNPSISAMLCRQVPNHYLISGICS
jgi:hypothetical protein